MTKLSDEEHKDLTRSIKWAREVAVDPDVKMLLKGLDAANETIVRIGCEKLDELITAEELLRQLHKEMTDLTAKMREHPMGCCGHSDWAIMYTNVLEKYK